MSGSQRTVLIQKESVRWGNKYLICRPRLEAYLNQLMVRERNKNDVGLEENHGVS